MTDPLFLRRVVRSAALAAVLLVVCAWPASAVSTALYRIFLHDGTALVSFGEFSRVGGRVVFSVPLGAALPSPALQLVSIPEDAVDWERTDRYTEAVRARRYAETRGDHDFALLTGRVVEALSLLASTPDPARRLAMAEEARRNLALWPSQNFGYRAADVAHLIGMLDEVVTELRVAAGQSSFDLSLVATTIPEPHVPLMDDPDIRETSELALVAASLTPEPTEKVSILRALTDTLKIPAEAGGWAAALLARTSGDLATELRLDRAYAALAASTRAAVRARSARGDVRGLQAAITKALTSDDRLGRRRPGEMSALLAFADQQLDEARRVRLARDAWLARRALLASYRREVMGPVEAFRRLKPWLDDIKELAGPAPRLVERLEQHAVMARQALDAIKAPAELASVHGTLSAAFQMARRAAATRRNAVQSRDMKLAWDASSAAAGALMLVDHALAELDRLTLAPLR